MTEEKKNKEKIFELAFNQDDSRDKLIKCLNMDAIRDELAKREEGEKRKKEERRDEQRNDN